MKESILSNARYAIGDGDGGKGAATKESRLFNGLKIIRKNNF